MPAPVEAEPAHITLDGVDIFLLFLGRIGVVEAQIAAPAEFLGHAEIEADRLGVTYMQVAVRLGRKARNNRGASPRFQIGAHDVPDEVLSRFPYCCLGDRHVYFRSKAPR